MTTKEIDQYLAEYAAAQNQQGRSAVTRRWKKRLGDAWKPASWWQTARSMQEVLVNMEQDILRAGAARFAMAA